MSATPEDKVQDSLLVHDALLDVVNTPARTDLATINTAFNAELKQPLRIYASATPDSKLNIAPNIVAVGDGAGRATFPIDGVSQTFPQASIDFQTGLLSPAAIATVASAAFSLPSSVTGQYRRVALALPSTGIVDCVFSVNSATYAGLTDTATLFAALGGAPLGYVDLVGTTTATFGSYKTASSAGVSATNVIENSVAGVFSIFRFGAGTGSGSGGDTSFKLQLVSSPNATLKGGYILLDDGRELASYDGTNYGKDISVNLTTVLGSAPANATAYYLYIDLLSLGSTVVLSATGRSIYQVTQSNFFLSTALPTAVDRRRYVPRAVIKTATAGNAWSGTGAGFSPLGTLLVSTVDDLSPLRSMITQAAHGFTSANQGAPLYLNGPVYTLARADVAASAEVVGVIESVLDVNRFMLIEAGTGSVGATTAILPLTVGANYFLSPTAAGQLSLVEPTVVGQVSKPVGIAKTTTTMQFTPFRGVTVGGGNLRANLGLAQAATTTIQNVSLYEAGQLSGWITISATTPLKFFLQAQFSRNGAGTDYFVGYQTLGDTPPTGFSVGTTASGLLQVVLPAITGFGSASINFALNAPAVGATFPLSVSGRTLIEQKNVTVYTGSSAVPVDGSTMFIGNSATPFTMSLGSSVGMDGVIQRFKNINTGAVTVAPFGSEKIDGQNSIVLSQYDGMDLLPYAGNWYII
jgi:hypothetical protein